MSHLVLLNAKWLWYYCLLVPLKAFYDEILKNGTLCKAFQSQTTFIFLSAYTSSYFTQCRGIWPIPQQDGGSPGSRLHSQTEVESVHTVSTCVCLPNENRISKDASAVKFFIIQYRYPYHNRGSDRVRSAHSWTLHPSEPRGNICCQVTVVNTKVNILQSTEFKESKLRLLTVAITYSQTQVFFLFCVFVFSLKTCLLTLLEKINM